MVYSISEEIDKLYKTGAKARKGFKMIKTLKIEKAGNADYNGLNCRMRTAFKNDKGEIIYFEFSVGHVYDAKRKNIIKNWLHIDFAFRISNEKENDACYSKDLYNDIVTNINNQKLEYNESNILYVLSLLGLTGHTIKYVDYYTTREYTPHTGKHLEYNLGNE